MAKKKYNVPVRPAPKRAEVIGGRLVGDEAKSVKVYPDGTLEAENFKERNSLGLSLNLSEKGNKFYFEGDIDSRTKVEYIPDVIHKQFRTTCVKTMAVRKAFALFEGEVKRFAVKGLDRYKSLNKYHKTQVDKILDSKNEYLFTTKRYGSFWNQIYIDQTQFGPYNYDTKLVVTKDLDFINDLIVVRTGGFSVQTDRTATNSAGYTRGPANNRIVWVSPHEVVSYSGAGHFMSSGYTNTGVPVESGLHSGATFHSRHLGLTNNTGVFALSSKYARILTDTQLKTETQYQLIDTADVHNRTVNDPVADTQFYYVYNEYAAQAKTDEWDGVVPSGATISIESWSTNPRYIGFDGNIEIQPVDSSLAENIDISHTVTGSAVNPDYQASVRQSVENAKKEFHKKVNKTLIDLGIKYKNRSKVRYDKLLERVAQNVYDGLGTSRNEHVARMQGLESLNPDEVPVYYDGTSSVYDGSKGAMSYDYTYTSAARLAGSGLGFTITKSAGGSSTSASSGGSSY